MQKQFLGTISALLTMVTLAGAQSPGKVATRGTTLETVGVSREGGSRINIEITTKDETAPWVETLDHPARIVVDLPNTVLAAGLGSIPIGTSGVKGIRVGTDAEKTTRVVVDLARLCGYELVSGSGHQLILKLDPTSPAPALAAGGASATPGAPVRSAYPSSSQSPPSQSAPRNAVTESAATNTDPATVVLPANAGVQASTESAARTVAPAGAPGNNGNTLMVASAQPNAAPPDPASGPAVPASGPSGASANPAASVAARGSETGAPAQGMVVGGHIGVVLPLVTRSNGTTTTISDSFSLGMPVGITLHGQGRMAFDMEFVPLIQNSPRQVSLTLHPGLLYGIGHGFTLGMRAAFVTNSSQFGFTPLVNKSWPIEGSFFKAYFAEFDLPVRFNQPAGLPGSNPVTFAVHFGLGF